MSGAAAGAPDGTFAAWRDLVEHGLAEAVAAPPGTCDAAAELVDAMRYALLGGGKRLRPLLTLAACRACGGAAEAALPAALAIELIHAYSLVHDDLPAMDDDDLRRGRPTTHKVYGEALGILAGDALQTRAFELLARAPLPGATVAQQVAALAAAAGPAGMAGGQALDLAAEGKPADADAVARIGRMKTGALLTACFELGALAAGAPPELRARLVRCGAQVGEAFQIQDDILDLTASTEQLGKTAGKDLAQGKATWPALVGLDAARRRTAALRDEALAELAELGPPAVPLAALVRAAVDRSH
ncbi:MAG: polyprenyl synthetase family protein [Acidobacteria bacterium]|nr:polyprenyl synthetase family protein [Acidobacteriota bacterium]